MVQTIQAKDIDLRYLITNFGIQFVEDEQFFREWQDDLPEISDLEKQLLDADQRGCSLVQFYLPPFTLLFKLKSINYLV